MRQPNPIQIERLPAADAAAVEIVERKGTGHPDAICDALAETASQALCRLYRDSAGMILHHNVDKVLLRAGQARPAFGHGQVIEPIERGEPRAESICRSNSASSRRAGHGCTITSATLTPMRM
jgi:S-adenosylmethionine synthetase